MAFALVGCTTTSPSVQSEAVSSSSDVTEPGDTTVSPEGWWYRPDDYVSEGFSMVNIFEVDMDLGMWFSYNKYGEVLYESSFTFEDDVFLMHLDFFADAPFGYTGDEMVDDEGNVHFVRGEPIEYEAPDLDGTWYQDGNTSYSNYVIDGRSYEMFYGYSGEMYEDGRWMLAEGTMTYDGVTTTSLQIEFEPYDEEDWLGGGTYIPDESFSVLYSPMEREFFMKGSVIDTPEGDNLLTRYNLILHGWAGEVDNEPILYFSERDTFSELKFVDGVGQTTEMGTWSYADGLLTLGFYDGTTETTELTEDGFRVEYYDSTFSESFF